MTVIQIDTDTQWKQLAADVPYEHRVPARRSRYGDSYALELGLTPFEAAYGETPDLLIPQDGLKEAITRAHEQQTFPLYHQRRTWAPPGFRSNQDGIGYCWTWSGTATIQDCMAYEDKDHPMLAPVSMGYLVGWRDRGNYLESYIKGAREDGVCPGEFNSHDRSSRKWPMDGERKQYRLDRVWDTDMRRGDDFAIQQIVSMLVLGVPLYIAYNWWSHALEMVGVRWDESKWKNFVPIIRNSHDEDDVIELTGSRGVPDESFGFVSTRQYAG